MPFYEYRCSECGHTLTKLQSMSAAPLTQCPECHKDTLVKLISASNCDLKGVGVFGSSKQPFKNESCSTPAAPSACASCPNAQSQARSKLLQHKLLAIQQDVSSLEYLVVVQVLATYKNKGMEMLVKLQHQFELNLKISFFTS